MPRSNDHRSPMKRAACWKMTNGACWYCGVRFLCAQEMTIDHVIPRSQGGHSRIENLVPCCAACNVKKGSLLAGEPNRKSFYKMRLKILKEYQSEFSTNGWADEQKEFIRQKGEFCG